MASVPSSSWYVVGYLRPIPGVLSFVFPVIRNEIRQDSVGILVCDDFTWTFLELGEHEEFVRVQPVALPVVDNLQDLVPIFGYEFISGRVWFGDACEMAKALVEFACENETISVGARQEVARFLWQVATRQHVVSKVGMLLEASRLQSQSDQVPLRIAAIGVGGGGANVIEYMMTLRPRVMDFICANTDAQSLQRSSADTVVRLGAREFGAETIPELGRQAAVEVRDDIGRSIQGIEILFIVAGMGGGTGTGAAPEIARVAREMGIFTLCIVTMPCEFEGLRRAKQASDGIVELQAAADGLVLVPNEKIAEVMGDDVTLMQVFGISNEVVSALALGMVDSVREPGLISFEIGDLKTVLSEPGQGRVGTATASGVDRARVAAEAAVASPLLEGVDLSRARGVLVNITANGSLTRRETREVMQTVRAFVAEDATVIGGTVSDENMGDELRVIVVVTGLAGPRPKKVPLSVVALPALRTGTDNRPMTATGAPRSPTDYGRADTRAVRRRGHDGAAARVPAPEDLDTDRIDIPTFLRRPAD